MGVSQKSQYDATGLAKDFEQNSLATAATDPSRQIFQPVLDAETREATLLDIGCGFGFDLENLRKKGFSRLFGVDHSKDQCDLARRYVDSSISIAQAAFDALPLASNSVDIVISRYTLHYIDEPQKAISEVARVLKDEGSFLFIVPNPAYDQAHPEWHRADGKISVPLYGGPKHVTYTLHRRSSYINQAFLDHFQILDERGSENADTFGTGVAAALYIRAKRLRRDDLTVG